MHHRHLLPNEFDLLLDRETGFGVGPLREHVRECSDCRSRLDRAQTIATLLNRVPLIAPGIGFADRVMARVPVFVPWHIAARDAVVGWMPASSGLRAVAVAILAMAGAATTGVTLWVVTRGEMVAMLTGLAGEGVRSAAIDAFGRLVVALFGAQAISLVQQGGGIGIALAAGGFVAASLGTVLGLRLAVTSSRARN